MLAPRPPGADALRLARRCSTATASSPSPSASRRRRSASRTASSTRAVSSPACPARRSFLDRITRIDAEPWKLAAGGVIEAEYDVPPDAWYFAADRRTRCRSPSCWKPRSNRAAGWRPTCGSALTSPDDLCFRNLGGNGRLHRPGRPRRRHADHARQHHQRLALGGHDYVELRFHHAVRRPRRLRGDTNFGFFSKPAWPSRSASAAPPSTS